MRDKSVCLSAGLFFFFFQESSSSLDSGRENQLVQMQAFIFSKQSSSSLVYARQISLFKCRRFIFFKQTLHFLLNMGDKSACSSPGLLFSPNIVYPLLNMRDKSSFSSAGFLFSPRDFILSCFSLIEGNMKQLRGNERKYLQQKDGSVVQSFMSVASCSPMIHLGYPNKMFRFPLPDRPTFFKK